MDFPVYCIFLLGFASFLQPVLGELCTYVEGESCVCETSKGIIDLNPLSSNGTARFTNIQDPEKSLYSFNPCIKFTEEDCKNAYICERDTEQGQVHTIADGDEKIVGNDTTNTFTLTYSSSVPVVNKIEVALICDQDLRGSDSNVVAYKEERFIYNFELHSCYACPGGCKRATISGYIGMLLIVLAILAFLLYFVIGAIVMKVRFHATGTDIIPNKNFWFSLPILVKDGCVFVVSPCLHLGRKKDGYSNI